MSGVKGKSGRKRKTLTSAQALQSLTQRLPKAIQVMGDTAEGILADRLRYEAARDIKDAVLGKPKAAVEIEGGQELGAGVVLFLLQVLREERRKALTEGYLLKEGEDGIQRQGNREGESKTEDEALQG